MPQGSDTLFKLTFSVKEAKGLFYVSSADHEEIFIAVTSREDIRRAVGSCLRNLYSRDGRRVRVYMNGQLDGPSVDAVVEFD